MALYLQSSYPSGHVFKHLKLSYETHCQHLHHTILFGCGRRPLERIVPCACHGELQNRRKILSHAKKVQVAILRKTSSLAALHLFLVL
jgi:hypothetical protein